MVTGFSKSIFESVEMNFNDKAHNLDKFCFYSGNIIIIFFKWDENDFLFNKGKSRIYMHQLNIKCIFDGSFLK